MQAKGGRRRPSLQAECSLRSHSYRGGHISSSALLEKTNGRYPKPGQPRTNHSAANVLAGTMPKEIRYSSGSKRAWKNRRYSGSYTILSPCVSKRASYAALTPSATTSMCAWV